MKLAGLVLGFLIGVCVAMPRIEPKCDCEEIEELLYNAQEARDLWQEIAIKNEKRSERLTEMLHNAVLDN